MYREEEEVERKLSGGKKMATRKEATTETRLENKN